MAQIILDSNNNLIQGDFDNATLNNRTKLQTTTTNATTNVYIAPNGSSTSAGVSVANNSSLTNASKIVMATNGTTDTQIISGVNGSGSYLPLSFYTNNALAGQFDTSGNLSVFRTTTGNANAIVISRSATNSGNSESILWQATDLPLDYASIGASATATTGTLTFSTASSSTNTERMRIDSSGNVLINQTANTYSGKLAMSHDSSVDDGLVIRDTRTSGSSTQVSFIYNTTQVGRILTTSSATSYITSSDYRLKENIVPMTGALDKVLQLKPVTYKWKVDGSDGQGFIAHELQAVVPDCVSGEKDAVETYIDEEGNEQTRIKPQGIDTSFLVATLTAAIQEQQAIINELKTRIEALESK
jgi:hypothetical protein